MSVASDLIDKFHEEQNAAAEAPVETTQPVETTEPVVDNQPEPTPEEPKPEEPTVEPTEPSEPSEPSENKATPTPAPVKREIPNPSSCDLLTYASAFIGIPYVYTGASLPASSSAAIRRGSPSWTGFPPCRSQRGHS